MFIKALQDFKYDGKIVKAETINDFPDAAAKEMIAQKVGELFTPKPTDEIKEVIVSDSASAKSVEAIVEAMLKQQVSTDKKVLDRQKFEDDSMSKTGGYISMGEFARDVYKAGGDIKRPTQKFLEWDKYTKAAGSGLVEGIDADGGFLVPTEFRNTLLKNSLEASLIKGRATTIPMQSNVLKMPTVVSTSNKVSVYGGVIVYRPSEIGVLTASKPKFGEVKLELSKLAGLAYVSSEMMEDSPISTAPLLNMMFSEAITFQQDEDYIRGTGTGQPLGILNSPALVTQAKESGQDADTVVTENIVNMLSRLKTRSYGSAVWFANQELLPQLALLSQDVGTGGSAVGLVQNIANSMQMALLGRPLIITEHASAIGDVGDLILGDWSQYLIGEKTTGMQVASSIHLKFDYDQTAFRVITRYDGQPWETAPMTPKNGTLTLGSFVTLAAR